MRRAVHLVAHLFVCVIAALVTETTAALDDEEGREQSSPSTTSTSVSPPPPKMMMIEPSTTFVSRTAAGSTWIMLLLDGIVENVGTSVITMIITLLSTWWLYSTFLHGFFTRPPPVPLKVLPKRPVLSILFAPEDPNHIVGNNNNMQQPPPPQQQQYRKPTTTPRVPNTPAPSSSSSSSLEPARTAMTSISAATTTPAAAATGRKNESSWADEDVGVVSSSTETTTTSAATFQGIHSSTQKIFRRLSEEGGEGQNDGYDVDDGEEDNHNDMDSKGKDAADQEGKIDDDDNAGVTTVAAASSTASVSRVVVVEDYDEDDDDDQFEDITATPKQHQEKSSSSDKKGTNITFSTSVAGGAATDGGSSSGTYTTYPTMGSSNIDMSLPDSFAPLLSSSHTEVLWNQLTPDLMHAVQLRGEIRMRSGHRHEIPLDMDRSRPQLILDVPANKGCRLSAVAMVGSDNYTNNDEELDVTIPTSSRSKPMVKYGSIVLDPPLPLSNVAPTLIHFPTLFEDSYVVPSLRRIQIIRAFMDFIVSISTFIERCLWVLESKCQIHLSKVHIKPIYKGKRKNHKYSNNTGKKTSRQPQGGNGNGNGKSTASNSRKQQQQHQPPVSPDSPDWRLSLAFSGHVMLFDWIPIPFINVVLPIFIIPQPHALLEHLLTEQPLASARLKRENIAEERIGLALIETIDTFKVDSKVIVTPPAIDVDVTLPGGLSVAMEIELGKDPYAGRHHNHNNNNNGNGNGNGNGDQQQHGGVGPTAGGQNDAGSVNSMSSWTTHMDNNSAGGRQSKLLSTSGTAAINTLDDENAAISQFDANCLVPWSLEFVAKGSVSKEKMSIHILKLEAAHRASKSQFKTRGSLAVWKYRPEKTTTITTTSSTISKTTPTTTSEVKARRMRFGHRRSNSFPHPELETIDTPSVAAILLFPDETTSYHTDLRMIQYDYIFDLFEETNVDAITVSVGATHPMLNGGTMVTTILDSIYAHGTISARENAILDPIERYRKRNILRHLPAIDFTFGIHHVFIPTESESYSDDGQTLVLPKLDGGRVMVRLIGGMDNNNNMTMNDDTNNTNNSSIPDQQVVHDGVLLMADFEVASLMIQTEGSVGEFPELEIFEGVKLRTVLNGVTGGTIRAHLRPQQLNVMPMTNVDDDGVASGPNVFNPLEAYEIDFSKSSFSLIMKEYKISLGHRRIIFPAESTFLVEVIESVVDMGFEGKTKCDLCWDFQGLSPILQQATIIGQTPDIATLENKQQAPILIAPLRQGRLTFHVSPVGGINITKAATSREDKEGLYDWKFFNALVSHDGSMERIIDVLHDKRSMEKLLQVSNVINEELDSILRLVLKQVWRIKEIFDEENITEPKDAIPMDRLARLIALYLTGDVEKVNNTILPIVESVVAGDGLDTVKVKELLSDHLDNYDKWASEIDRAVRWAAVALGPMSVSQPYVEDQVLPLAEQPQHSIKFQGIPSASQLYQTLVDNPQMPLDLLSSSLISRVAPYLSFSQVRYMLQIRAPSDWQSKDLRRVRYVYSIKRKVLDIAEGYGGLSFLPQSFLVSVFLGEATRTSLRASRVQHERGKPSSIASIMSGSRSKSRSRSRAAAATTASSSSARPTSKSRDNKLSTLSRLRSRPMGSKLTDVHEDFEEDRTYRSNRSRDKDGSGGPGIPESLLLTSGNARSSIGCSVDDYELGDSLLGPQDVAILLQAGLTSVMNSSTVVQLNQRMLLNLICSQPRSFPVAVLAEISNGSPRSLTSALMALLELDQTAFTEEHKIDMNTLLESWLPGLKIPRREDYMAGGRWARQSYYEALFSVANSILQDAETYMALKGHLQRVRLHEETAPLPQPRYRPSLSDSKDEVTSRPDDDDECSLLKETVDLALSLIAEADAVGSRVVEKLLDNEERGKKSSEYQDAIRLYQDSFDICAKVLSIDKHAFHADWFATFYKRNYDALMIKSMYDNVVDDVDSVRYWLNALRKGVAKAGGLDSPGWEKLGSQSKHKEDIDNFTVFTNPEKHKEQEIVDAVIDSTIYERSDRDRLRQDPLVRLLISNRPGKYDFVIVSAMGVITEGKLGLELKDAFDRLEEKRGVKVIRADTGTARSLEFNASKISEAIHIAADMKKPYGLLGYSQGCANILVAESTLLSGSPKQRETLNGLVCRQLLFSAANGSFHAPAMEKKVQRLFVLCEEFFKYQQGYVSSALSTTVLGFLNSILDSAHFHKIMGGAQSFLPDGCREFWREAQHLSHVPTCTIRGVMEDHTTPECLEMISHLLTKQSGSSLHDSQVHVFDAVGYPVYYHNRNGHLLKKCSIGEGCIQRTHHWSPLSDEVEFVRTTKDIEFASFDCGKDRHVIPWVDVNVRFGFIKYSNDDDKAKESSNLNSALNAEMHPSKLMSKKADNSK